MIDTAGFFVRLSYEDYRKLMTMGILTKRVRQDSGFVEFEYTNFRLNHSFHYSVLWKLDDKEFVRHPDGRVVGERGGDPYLRLEFSSPKILFGHNLVSIDIEGFISACSLVRDQFEKMTGVLLPGPGQWYIYRLDVCANFLLDDIENVKSYIRYIQRLDYPRRPGNSYKDTGLYFASRHSTLKVYCKGEEFKKHDAVRFADSDFCYELQKEANNILRIEVELKRRIRYLIDKYEVEHIGVFFNRFKGSVCFEDFLQVVNIEEELRYTMRKFLVGEETKVMRSRDVFGKLCSSLGERAARSAYAVYMMLVTQGQSEVKRAIPERTYYRYVRIFRELGISVVASDVVKDDSFEENPEFCFVLDRGFPQDFSLELSEGNKYYQLPKAA